MKYVMYGTIVPVGSKSDRKILPPLITEPDYGDCFCGLFMKVYLSRGITTIRFFRGKLRPPGPRPASLAPTVAPAVLQPRPGAAKRATGAFGAEMRLAASAEDERPLAHGPFACSVSCLNKQTLPPNAGEMALDL